MDAGCWRYRADRRQVDAAKATVEKVSTEEKTLKETLSHIEDTRPWEDITVSFPCHGKYGVCADLPSPTTSPRQPPKSARQWRPWSGRAGGACPATG